MIRYTLLAQLIRTAVATCYFAAGGVSPGDVPCSTSGQSTCCAPGWSCLSNNMCVDTSDPSKFASASFARGSCTDQTWQSSSCLQRCLNASTTDTLQAGGSINLCPGTTTDFYCVNQVLADCSNGLNIFKYPVAPSVVATSIQSSVPTTASSPTSAQTTASNAQITSGSTTATQSSGSQSTQSTTSSSNTATSSATNSPSNSGSSQSNTLPIALGVAIPLGILTLAVVSYLIYRVISQKKRYAASAWPSSEKGDSAHAYTAQEVRTADGYYAPMYASTPSGARAESGTVYPKAELETDRPVQELDAERQTYELPAERN